MSSDRVGYEISIRGPEGLHREDVEHELRFTQDFGGRSSQATVIFLTDDELRDLFHAAGKRLGIDWHA